MAPKAVVTRVAGTVMVIEFQKLGAMPLQVPLTHMVVQARIQESKEKRHGSFMKLYDTIKFDLLHNHELLDKEPVLKGKKTSESEITLEEKENNREYTNA